jgi:hypothetical protein
VPDRTLLDPLFEDVALVDAERDYGHADVIPVDAPGPKLCEPIDVGADPADWRGHPGFLDEGDLPTVAMVHAWNRMLGIVRKIGEAGPATGPDSRSLHASLAREFYGEAVGAVRETRSRDRRDSC